MKKILSILLLLASCNVFSQGTILVKDHIKATTDLTIGTVKVTAIQKTSSLTDSTKIPTSLAVKNYVTTSTSAFISVQQSRVTSDYNKTSSTTLSNVPGLTANVDSGKTYYFEARVFTNSDASCGVKFAIGGTCVVSLLIYDGITNEGSATGQGRATSLGDPVGAITAVTEAYTFIVGTITVSTTGTLTVKFANNVSTGATGTVMIGSVFIVSEIL